jgi:hypothetical protein|tara:strand:- start:198 stop:815 length:618 start_codon:yes stop_codon:yes gene_type:complete
MSKALLIGNGPSAIEKEMGKRIDSNEFDKVIRFNRWKFDLDGSEYKEDFSKYVGTRCDYWVVNDLHITETKLGISKKDLYELVLAVMPKFKFDKVFVNTIESQHTNIEFIPPEYEDDINSIVNFLPKWPSTGVMGMHFAIHHFDEVFLYGFDSFDVKYDTQHYFEDETAEYGKNKYKLNPASDHIPLKEKEYINYMVKNNKLNIL